MCNHFNLLLPELTPKGKVPLIGPIVHVILVLFSASCLVYPPCCTVTMLRIIQRLSHLPKKEMCILGCGYPLAIRYHACSTNKAG